MAKRPPKNLPAISRAEFFLLKGEPFLESIFNCLERAMPRGRVDGARFEGMSLHQIGAYAWWPFQGEVNNGGLSQFFYNRGDSEVAGLLRMLRDAGADKVVEILKLAAKIYRKNLPAFATNQPFGEEGLFDSMDDLSELDQTLAKRFASTNKLVEKWLRANVARIVVGDDGKPIDPTFTGVVESRHPSATLFEQAEVRNGKLRGAYRRWREDGTLERANYRSPDGRVQEECWPDGRPMRRTIVKGKRKTEEWFYESGALRKRYVGDDNGAPLEPVRVWHENSRLAEEISLRSSHEKLGPWRKWFDDGAPKLDAEWRESHQLFVRNAWDDDRRQTVKNGSGTFMDDGIDWSPVWQLMWDFHWTHSYKLRKGLLHGIKRTWNHGVHWSDEPYVNGRLHGVGEEYWDNGRVRTRTVYYRNVRKSTEEFPKFDDPRPVVKIDVQANEKLYRGRGVTPLDAYPRPTNLEQAESRLAIPDFLKDVHRRHLEGTPRSSYEDVNTFDDATCYLAIIDAKGSVTEVHWTGAAPYSAPVIGLYPDVVRKLKFEPGRLGGRKVESRAFVQIRHTFAEADEPRER